MSRYLVILCTLLIVSPSFADIHPRIIYAQKTKFFFSKGKRYLPPEPIMPGKNAIIGKDPLLDTSWHLERIGALDVWNTVTRGRPDITIAVLDSGINYNHPEFIDRIKRKPIEFTRNKIDDDANGLIDDYMGWNFTNSMIYPWDDNGHGTFVASIIAASANNTVGGAGVCPECSLLPIRFTDEDGSGYDEDAISAIRLAVKEKVSVINYSNIGEGFDQDFHDAMEEALKNDIVVVVSAGNHGENNDRKDYYPANSKLPNVLTVAAARRDGHLWQGSSYGPKKVHVAAPGTTIWGLWVDGKWYRGEGTSLAAPVVSGAVGLVRSAAPHISATDIVKIMINTSTPTKGLQGMVVSNGMINVQAAIQCALDSSLPCLKKKK